MCEVVNSSRFPAPTALTIALGSQFQKSIRACKRRGKRRSEPPPPIPHAHARIGHGVHRCCQETKGFTQGPPKPFAVCGAPHGGLQETPSRCVGDLTEALGHLEKTNEMPVEAHLEIACTCFRERGVDLGASFT